MRPWACRSRRDQSYLGERRRCFRRHDPPRRRRSCGASSSQWRVERVRRPSALQCSGESLSAATVSAVTTPDESRRAIDRVLAADYLTDLASWTLEELKAHKHECQEVENSVSFARRVAQGRLEILRAECKRRAEGGSIADLVASLPEILGSDQARASIGTARYPTSMAPDLDHDWGRGLETVMSDTSLIELPTIADAELQRRIDELEAFEHEVSAQRSALHAVIDRLEAAFVERSAHA